MMKADCIKNKINALALRKTPFLFAVDFELSNGILVENPLRQKKILFRTPQATNINEKFHPADQDKRVIAYPEPFPTYNGKFKQVMDALQKGDSFLTNLTVKTRIETPLSLQEIAQASTSPYTLCLPDKFVCFSPERFIRIAHGTVSTNPMKGTLNADIPDAETVILSNPKETAEHHTIVDLLRNDLGIIAHDITVNRFRYIDRITTGQRDILQVSSEITGVLDENYLSGLGDLIFKLLPAGSVSGAPKPSTLQIIRKAEGEPRGYYTGIFGYFDGEAFDSAVMIRFIEEENGITYFRSGGGITASSEARSEYNEVFEKIYLPFI